MIDIHNEFWNGAERQILCSLLNTDLHGFEKSLEDQALMTWLSSKLEESDEYAFGMPGKVVLSVMIKWKNISDKDPDLLPFYKAWRVSKEDSASLLADLKSK